MEPGALSFGKTQQAPGVGVGSVIPSTSAFSFEYTTRAQAAPAVPSTLASAPTQSTFMFSTPPLTSLASQPISLRSGPFSFSTAHAGGSNGSERLTAARVGATETTGSQGEAEGGVDGRRIKKGRRMTGM
ncbi:hypothetical protein M427DRAFT_32272 [Gonapodya prolifera JEL478]|uniref:Uncharacterized protein n=1 Tax=Gonapodya prolifera (strain JEL478) TaxID=1344416 RepID=A0A139AGL3_GONPJ|nr:hypothetical protein M427DRAFT_32272 [Gonapodya prolifera JEL478]|eukprot:KXS15585.1 hypothetical protein M427DRAFT_32272 [Gonapodya prolifera JEL478]